MKGCRWRPRTRGLVGGALTVLFFSGLAVGAVEDAAHVGEWLVLGTVPFERQADPFETAASPGVLEAVPREGDVVEGMKWQRLKVDAAGQANLISRGFLKEEIVCAYLLAYVHSEVEQTVVLSVGSDDGIQVFVNGYEVHRNWALRGWEADQDAVVARLGAGWNRVLLRVANLTGGFGGSARILDASGENSAMGVRAQATRPGDYQTIRTAAFLQLEEVVPEEALSPGPGNTLYLRLLAGVRNLGTEAASGVHLEVVGASGILAAVDIALEPGERLDVSLQLDAMRVAREIAAGSPYQVTLAGGVSDAASVPLELKPQTVLRIVTAQPALQPELDAGDVSQLLENWKWGETFRPDLFSGDDRRFRDLLAAYVEGDRKGFRDHSKGIRRAIRDGGREIRKQKITFIGNSHIDMAWLWPRAETIEVVDMTYDQALKFTDEFSFFQYAQSQMQTYVWVEERFPEMMKRLDAAVRKGEWLPVGGMWVEADCNLPSGESFVRQLLYGKGYIRDRYGIDIRVGWNPDSFGYAWTLPMIFKGAGIDYFITQKIGWNDTTEFPHRLFWWQSPDGSRVLTYFPFTYVDDARPEVLAERLMLQQEQQPGLGDMLNLYGVGDHGGGPTREMIERYRSMSKIETFPEVEHAHPREFFEKMEEKHAASAPTWNDELYLEYHRGTFTTQGEMKRSNRRMESSLETAEKFAALAAGLSPGYEYPDIALDGAWKRTLFNQFHDILPGTSIPEVYEDARNDYSDAELLLSGAHEDALAELVSLIDTDARKALPVVVFNPLSWTRTALVTVSLKNIAPPHDALAVVDSSGVPMPSQPAGEEMVFLAREVPGIGYRTFWLQPGPQSVGGGEAEAGSSAGRIYLRNDRVWAEIDLETGGLSSLIHLASGREMLDGGGNQLQLLEDTPSQWDAWNIGYTGKESAVSAVKVEVVEEGPLRAVVQVERRIGDSILTQDYIVETGGAGVEIRTHADWNEDHKFLKAAFHLAVDAEVATFEIPYGTIERPTRPETEAEKAKWEVPGQRWVDMTDRSGAFGVTLVNDSKYGYDVLGRTLRLSLLRAPKWPDPEADIGEHRFSYALVAHAGGWRDADSYRRGAEFNLPHVPVLARPHSGEGLPSEVLSLGPGAGT